MKWTEVKVIFEHPDRDLAVDLISDIFYSFGLQGVAVESTVPDEDADWADGAQKIPDADSVSAYFPKDGRFGDSLRKIRAELDRLAAESDISTRIVFKEMDEEDWAESWKEYFWPEKVGKNIVVKPTWRDYAPEPGEIVLEIDPGMAFGTGTHPTTSMCIQLIEKYLHPGDSILDIGTGSGILLTAAAKLGAGNLCGIDNDPVAVDIAGKNLLLNQTAPEQFTVVTGHLAEKVHQHFDLIIANILTNVILELLDSVPGLLCEHGIFVCSGIISENREKVTQKMEKLGFEIAEVIEKEGWVGIAGIMKSEK
ncbi:MAG: 50S ribosomal protein L11 methyltransferase [Desulfococcaceae bacterium]